MRRVRAPRLFDGWFPMVVAGIGLALCAAVAGGQPTGLEGLAKLTPGRTKAENALWIENPLTAQFKTSKRVVVADLKGPAVITMIHFAYGQSQISTPKSGSTATCCCASIGTANLRRAWTARWWISSATRPACATRSTRRW